MDIEWHNCICHLALLGYEILKNPNRENTGVLFSMNNSQKRHLGSCVLCFKDIYAFSEYFSDNPLCAAFIEHYKPRVEPEPTSLPCKDQFIEKNELYIYGTYGSAAMDFSYGKIMDSSLKEIIETRLGKKSRGFVCDECCKKLIKKKLLLVDEYTI